jgi:ceramide glucosyltransferase
LFFLPEILSGILPPLGAAAFVAHASDVSILAAVTALAAVWYGAEAALARTAHWQVSALYPLHALLRDLLLPCLWCDALLGAEFEWRGHAMSVAEDSETVEGQTV